jgi:hypothetical protein
MYFLIQKYPNVNNFLEHIEVCILGKTNCILIPEIQYYSADMWEPNSYLF